MKSSVRTSLLTALLFGVFAVSAQEHETLYPTDEWGRYLEPALETQLTPRADVELVRELPGGFFFRRGTHVATATPDTTFTVKETATVPSLWGTRHYIKVEPAHSQDEKHPCANGCWVYQGKDGASLPENLLPPNVKPVRMLDQ